MNAAEIRRQLARFPLSKKIEHNTWRPAAVLVALQPGKGVWLTRRSLNMTHHAGQVSFPGGRIEDSDVSIEEAALRECREEIGVAREMFDVVGFLDQIVTGTGFHIIPVLAIIEGNPIFSLAAGEVADIFCLPFSSLLDSTLPIRRQALNNAGSRSFFVWPERDHVIWGATATILMDLAKRLR